jgi:hypothetical protein
LYTSLDAQNLKAAMSTQDELKYYQQSAERFGSLIEDDAPLVDDFRDATELPAPAHCIVMGIAIKVVQGLPIEAASEAISALAQYHEGLGERVKGAGTLLHESSAQEGQRSLIDRLLKGKARSEVVGQMKGLQASLASIDQGRLDRLHSESQEQLHVYFGLLERILKSVEGSD